MPLIMQKQTGHFLQGHHITMVCSFKKQYFWGSISTSSLRKRVSRRLNHCGRCNISSLLFLLFLMAVSENGIK